VQIGDINELNIDDYVEGKEINYIAIPLVDSSLAEDFLNGLKFTDGDIDPVIDKMDRDVEWISVIVPKEMQSSLYEEEINDGDDIFDKFAFTDLVEIGHSEYCTTKIFKKTINLFEGRKNELYLPFDETRESYYHYLTEKKRKELFMRSVLIKDYRFHMPVSATIFEINALVTNINSKKFIPDISRNNVDDKTKEIIDYIIGKAIHRGAHDALSLGTDEKDTLGKFITTFYNKKSEFEIEGQ
jgi:hypothetical protein